MGRVCIGGGGRQRNYEISLMLYLFERIQLPFVSLGNWFQDPPHGYQNPKVLKSLTVSQPFISVDVTPTDMESLLYMFDTYL